MYIIKYNEEIETARLILFQEFSNDPNITDVFVDTGIVSEIPGKENNQYVN